MNFLISKGAPINVIIDSITPLQMAISSCFLKGVQILISLGASLGFNGLQTALNACTGCSNSEIVTLIKSKADNDYESRYKNYSPPTFSSSSNEDLIRRINSKYRNPLPSNINLDMLSDMMNNSYDYDIALNILLSIANIDHSPIDILTPEQAEFRDKLPIHIRNELWNFVKNNINNSYPVFRTAYCAITGAKLDNPYSRHSHLLFIATRLGNFNAVKNLIEYGASIEEVEGFSCFFSPSLEAISKDRSDILSLFIKAGLRFDHIYSNDNFTLINACIEFNSMKCFDLLFEKSSLRHVVVETPMMAVLQTFERTGNDYFINKLIDKIDIEYEHIVDPSFAEYLLFKEGKIPKFHYTSYQRPKLTRKTNNINILVDKLNQSGIAQPILAYKVLEVNFHANINEVNRLRIPVILH
ncbi:hypothetical protein TVAG_058670 [Trichomonas vaginalis G3]|uniref:Uncharacterized protein n=1 Tax=Trichomonas vaginalis (strain ATCC PRA-98 / G3) TaxID=412133 RepID=A2FJY1_TRIV3|nr:ankyrin repeat and EF-Hand domain-containing protein 1 family [Trichomonas vaginalis G3]EAX94777.1 hypothetical protein TVAG_058670 [Trichomonas vaginalis G3]KAI5518418.1 ankyrin repeat and EF-Hand domain-containing protein 1 family [Trichomonas vaginalis G3]|eukprot:XP_001307707.1 hypothetical protein [Trichomonas vaginalis G3]